jgi:hypothetical protein
MARSLTAASSSQERFYHPLLRMVSEPHLGGATERRVTAGTEGRQRRANILEARTGVEPIYKVLQTSA